MGDTFLGTEAVAVLLNLLGLGVYTEVVLDYGVIDSKHVLMAPSEYISMLS